MDAGNKKTNAKKIVIYVIISLAVLYSVKNTDQRIALASAIGTIVAAYAAWQAAREAANSAKIARESMDATKALGLETLKETQMANERTAFESRYTMLLAHHDHYHQQLCAYLDTYWQKNKVYEMTEADKSWIIEIEKFFYESIYAESPNDCFSFLTGHQIISRYMRVLYHLLKFVREKGQFNGPEHIIFQKSYTSSLRSTIRNDVLLLIAVNALNVRDERARNSSFPYYQQLLHDFCFFEHAIFMFPSNPNFLFSRNDWETRIHDLVIQKQSNFITKLTAQTGDANQVFRVPEVRLISPMIMVLYIFDNPMRDAVLKAFESLGTSYVINEKVIDIIKEVEKNVQSARLSVDKISLSEYKSPSNDMWRTITEDMVSEIHKSTFSSDCIYDKFNFRLPGNSNIMVGSQIRDYLKTIKRGQSILEEFGIQNGAEGFIHYLAQRHNETINSSLCKIKSYNVMSAQYAAQQSQIAVEE